MPSIKFVSSCTLSPPIVHLQAVKRILRYLKGSLGLGLTITPGPLTTFFAFSDADWAGCPDSRRSTTGFRVFLGKNLLTWVSKKQPTLSRSSAEAEYKVLALTTSELLWLSYLLRDREVPFRYQFILHCDNASATHLAANPVFHACSKHIEVYYHFVRDLVIAGKLLIRLVRSNKKVADIFPQGLPEPAFHHFRGKLLSPACPSLERNIGYTNDCLLMKYAIPFSFSLSVNRLSIHVMLETIPGIRIYVSMLYGLIYLVKRLVKTIECTLMR